MSTPSRQRAAEESEGASPYSADEAPANPAVSAAAEQINEDASPAAKHRRRLRLVIAPTVLALLVVVVWLLGTTLLPFIVAGLLAVLLSPVVERMTRWKLMPRAVAAVLVTAGVVLLIAGIMAAITPMLVREVTNLTQQLPDILSQVYWWVRLRVGDTVDLPTQEDLRQRVADMVMPVGTYIDSALSYGLSLFSTLLLVFITPFLTAYLLADWPRVLRRSDSLLPRRSAPTIRSMMNDMRVQLGAYIRGQLLIVLWQGVLHAAGLMLIGLNFGLIIGILTGLGALVPVIGNLTMFSIALIVAVIQFETIGPVLGVIGIYALSQLLETTVLTPWLVGERVRLHPVWVIFALLIGGSLFGLVGALLAMPVAAVLRVLFGYTAERYRSSKLYEEL
ncbi:permease, putative [Caenispirillum salinarum AK4]|uniref:Permease, putative n=1 Tax=Caenispirillum salinarum AK4 TaxID=1238182 RepID=K9HIG1_9PROT|nr:AI-2E family transporter [Caenispirillum salinarum]EKV28406.1 permease, putative [Caenispirillum salinarum AK4]